MTLRFIAVFVLVSMLTACFPVHYQLRPGVSGSVVDDSTSAPVGNATVMLSRVGQADRPLFATVTDMYGRFAIPVRRAWGIYVVPEDVAAFWGTVDIYASGYVKASREVSSKIVGSTAPTTLGEIRVKRAPTVEIRISSSLKGCFIADAALSCSEVGAKLQSLNVPADSDIHSIGAAGDANVTYESVQATLQSIRNAGYHMKVGTISQ